MMAKRFALLYSTVLLMIVAGCATNRDTGLLAGSALGAGTGALVGSQLGNTGAGALVGAGVGALSGGLIGEGLDETERKANARIAAATAPAPSYLTSGDVVRMTQSGVAEETILSSIKTSNTSFRLTAVEIVDLHNQGVSDRVIQEMINSSQRTVRYRPVVQPVYYHSDPVIVVGHHWGHGGCW